MQKVGDRKSRAVEAPSLNKESEAPLPTTIRLQPIKIAETEFKIVGLTPVIPHAWSEKSKRMMRDKQTGVKATARGAREPKNPEQEAMDSCYWMDEERTRPAMPATAFKAAIVGASRMHEGITLTLAKTLIYVVGEGEENLVEIHGKPVTFESTPRNSSGVPDLRYRKKIYPWTAIIKVRYQPHLIDVQSLAVLVQSAGQGGVGDWRPSSPKSLTGTYGTWKLDATSEVSS